MPTVLQIKASVRARDGFRCTLCGLSNDEHKATTGKQLEVHRVVPGSVYTAEGCATLCRRCHGPQPRRRPGQPDLDQSRSGASLFAWIDEQIMEALECYVDGTEPRVSKTAAIEAALKDFLRKHGHWPPAA